MDISYPMLNFSGGEIDPTLWGRADLQKQTSAMRICHNGYPHLQGGWSNRTGTQYISSTKFANRKNRLQGFEYSVIQAYMLEVGHLYIRFYKDGGRINVSGVPAYNGSTAYVKGDLVSSSGTNYYCIASTTGNAPPNATYWYALTGSIYEIPTTYQEADLPLLKFEQSANDLIITHPNYAPARLTRTGDTSWTLNSIAFLPTQDPPTSLTASPPSGSHIFALTAINENEVESILSNTVSSSDTATLTWVAASGAVKYNIYRQVNGLWGFCFQVGAITSYTLTSITPDYNKAPPTFKDYFSGADDKPGCAAFYQQRLLWGRTDNDPQSVFCSSVGQPYTFGINSPVQDDNAFKFTINDRRVNEIKSITPMSQGCVIGTSGSVVSLTAVDDGVLTPTTAQFKVQERQWGMNDMKPLVVGNRVVYFDYSNRRVRDLFYDITAYGYQGSELTQWARHLFKDAYAIDWDFQAYPDSIGWIVMSDGTLKGLSYQREAGASDFVAWHRHSTDGLFEAVSTIPSGDGESEVWFTINRTINGSTVRYVERLATRNFNDIRNAWFVDCGLQYDNKVSVSGITKASVGVVTANSHGFSNGDMVRFSDLVGMDELNSSDTNRYYRVAGVTTNTFTLKDIQTNADINTTGYTTYVSGGYVAKAITAITGLSHLEGKQLCGLADGRVVKALTVSSGAVNLTAAASKIIIGLPYIAEGMPVNYEFNYKGTIQDKTRYIRSVYVSMVDTRGVAFAPDANTRAQAAGLTSAGIWADPTPLFTGDVEVNVLAGKPKEGALYWIVSDPAPCTITRVIAKLATGVD